VAAPPPIRVIRPETAIAMRQMMEGVVLRGTGGKAHLDGYSSGGKTGSAQIYDFHARRFTHSYNASYLGFAPVTNPAIVMVVTINGTHGTAGFGGAVAAPVYRAIATEALRVLDVPKDVPELEMETQVADARDLNDLPLGDLESAEPEEAQESEAAVESAAVPAEDSSDDRPKVPDFQGMTVRAALARASELGISIVPDGSGVARVQDPPPGAILREGARIRVRFSR
jgi:membrane peptidoglycan carboxypeptidase